MRIVNNVEEALSAAGGKESLTVIIEEASRGLELMLNKSGDELIGFLHKLIDKYGQALRFRLFNDEIDIDWRGDYGIVIEEILDKANAIDIYLESDTKRHPGMLNLAETLGDLKKCRLQAQLVANGSYLRLGKIIGGG